MISRIFICSRNLYFFLEIYFFRKLFCSKKLYSSLNICIIQTPCVPTPCHNFKIVMSDTYYNPWNRTNAEIQPRMPEKKVLENLTRYRKHASQICDPSDFDRFAAASWPHIYHIQNENVCWMHFPVSRQIFPNCVFRHLWLYSEFVRFRGL